jgi:hypothetical protein
LVIAFGRKILKTPSKPKASIIDQHINGKPALHNLLLNTLGNMLNTQIKSQNLGPNTILAGQFRSQRLQAIRAAGNQDQMHPALRQFSGKCLANPR